MCCATCRPGANVAAWPNFSVSAEDQAVIVVEVKVVLDQGGPASDWPPDDVADVKQRVREAVRGTEADHYDRFFSADKAGAPACASITGVRVAPSRVLLLHDVNVALALSPGPRKSARRRRDPHTGTTRPRGLRASGTDGPRLDQRRRHRTPAHGGRDNPLPGIPGFRPFRDRMWLLDQATEDAAEFLGRFVAERHAEPRVQGWPDVAPVPDRVRRWDGSDHRAAFAARPRTKPGSSRRQRRHNVSCVPPDTEYTLAKRMTFSSSALRTPRWRYPGRRTSPLPGPAGNGHRGRGLATSQGPRRSRPCPVILLGHRFVTADIVAVAASTFPAWKGGSGTFPVPFQPQRHRSADLSSAER